MRFLPKLINQLNRHRTFVSILLIGIILRSIRFFDIAKFSHDNARDIYLLYRMYEFKEIIYRGPEFSIIWGFVSPIYYYILLLFAYFSNFHPLTAPVLTMIINIVTIIAIYISAKEMFSKNIAIIASAIYSFSFYVILGGANGLNPNFSALFSVLLILALFKISKGHEKFLILASLCVSMLLSFHPSGAFVVLPTIIILYIYRNIFKYKTILIALVVMLFFLVMPYAIQEKKFNGYTSKKIFDYVLSGKSEDDTNKDRISYPYVLSKNISLLLFDLDEKDPIFASFIFIIYLCYEILRYKKIDKNRQVLILFLFIYVLTFGLTLKFDKSQTLDWWFQTTFIPLIVIYIAVLIDQYIHNKRLIIALLLSIFTVNLVSLITYVPEVDSYSTVKSLTTLFKSTTESSYDIYGTDPRPFLYMAWYTEKDVKKREKYYLELNWPEKKENNEAFYITYKSFLTPERIAEIKFKQNVNKITELSSSTKIYWFHN